MCEKFVKSYTCGHEKTQGRRCLRYNLLPLISVILCQREMIVTIGRFHYDCFKCTEREVEQHHWMRAPEPLPAPIVRREDAETSDRPPFHVSSRTVGSYDGNTAKLEGPGASVRRHGRTEHQGTGATSAGSRLVPGPANSLAVSASER